MPEIGDVINARELGLKAWDKRIWVACEECGCGRWAALKKGRAVGHLCVKCRAYMHRNGRWNGGKCIEAGYCLLKLAPSDFFFRMANIKGYVYEHRLLMAQHLRRCLWDWEIVHHKNGDKLDNRLENLELITQSMHIIHHLGATKTLKVEAKGANGG